MTIVIRIKDFEELGIEERGDIIRNYIVFNLKKNY
jgi:hypothetical protein